MNPAAGLLDAMKSRRLTDHLAVATAISLPWSTSATAALMIAWGLAYLPSLRLDELRREILTWAGGLPLVLFAWAEIGVLWAEASWSESFGGLRQFWKLLFIPVALAYFRRSEAGPRVMAWFIASCVVLLAVSLVVGIWPGLQWWRTSNIGVPVKTYITQSAEFAVAAFCLFYVAVESWRTGARGLTAGAAIVAFAFLGDILYIATSRTELVVLPILVLLFAMRFFGWKGAVAGLVALAAVGAVAWSSSGYLRQRLIATQEDAQAYISGKPAPADGPTSTEYRLEIWRKSLSFVASAPLLGHGTGSIKPLFEQAAASRTGLAAVVTDNPHNQILTVMVQLGIPGAILLGALWLSHAAMFWRPGVVAWLGLVIVIQNVLGSLFNNHLFDFTEGWLYVCGVGVLGGTCRRLADTGVKAPAGASLLGLLRLRRN